MLVGGRLAIINVAPTHWASLNLKMGAPRRITNGLSISDLFQGFFVTSILGDQVGSLGRSCLVFVYLGFAWPRCSEKVPKTMDFQTVVKDGDESHGIIRKKSLKTAIQVTHSAKV